VLILLPPSEGKTRPARGKPLDLEQLSFPALRDARQSVLDALVHVCRSRPAHALDLLGLSPNQAELIERDAHLDSEPTATADRVYTGVLYDSLNLRSLDPTARRKATRTVVISSALFGAVRIRDRIPAYRLSVGTTLPRAGALNSLWRKSLGPVMTQAMGTGLAVDLRSSPYVAMWRPTREQAQQVVSVRVLAQHSDGRRITVSHFNKSTKGELARALIRDAKTPRTVDALAEIWSHHGFVVDVPKPAKDGTSPQLHVITAT